MRSVGGRVNKPQWHSMPPVGVCRPARAVRPVFSRKIRKDRDEEKPIEIVKPIETRDEARVGMSGGGLLRLAQRELRGVVDYLFEKGWRPNHITLLSMGLTTLQGLAVFFLPTSSLPLLILPGVAIGRLLLDVADGLMARRYDLKTKTGAVLNEVEYVYSDIALYLPLALVPGVPALWMTTVVGLTVVSELVGIGCRLIGHQRRFDGPLAKLNRTAWFSGAALALGLGASPAAYHWMDIFLGTSVLLLSLTIGNRLFRAFFERSYTRGLSEVEDSRDDREALLQHQALKVLEHFDELRCAVVDDQKVSDTLTLFDALAERFEKARATQAKLLPGLVTQARNFTARTQRATAFDRHEAEFFANVADAPVGDFANAAGLQTAILEATCSAKPRKALILVDCDNGKPIKRLREDLKRDEDLKQHEFEVQRFTPFEDALVGKINSFQPNLISLGSVLETLRSEGDMKNFIGQLANVMPAGGIVVGSTVWSVDPVFYVNHARRNNRKLPVGLVNPKTPNKELAQMFKDAGFEILEQKVTKHDRLCTYVFQKKE